MSASRRGGTILTVTPNPSLDLLFEHDRLVWDDANRMADPRRRPGGQGINVARAARVLGADAMALSLLGGRTGSDLAAALAAEGTRHRAVFAVDETRTFVAVRERESGRSLLLNARGHARSTADALALEQLVADSIASEPIGWIAGCGSLPAGFPPDFYARIARRAHQHGIRFVADCDGEPLRHALDAGCDLLVPNQHEAARLLHDVVDNVAAAARAARTLQSRGTTTVAITLGARGAVLANAYGCWHARPPALDAGSAVGAGDAFLAALLIHIDGTPHDALAHAVAAGTATLQAQGNALLHHDDVISVLPQITVSDM